MARIVVSSSPRQVVLPVELPHWHTLGLSASFRLGEVQFTSFKPADTDALLEVRNDVGVLPFMPSSEPLALDRHRTWVNSNLLQISRETPLVLIGRHDGQPVAMGVIKPSSEDSAFEIGLMVIQHWQRRGLPARLAPALAFIASTVLNGRDLFTFVNPSHEQALRFNRAWGLLSVPSVKQGEICFRAPVKELLSTPLYQRCTRELRVEIG